MATLKKRRGVWYARVLWYLEGRQKERQLPLKTKKKVVAMERLRIINRYELDIKNGMSFTWPWISNESSVNVKRFTLIDACYKWMQKRQNYRKTTLSINNQGLFYLTDCLGKNTPLESILNTDIDRFIDYLKTKGLSDVSVNIHLRTVKSMFRYWLKRERLTKVPLIEQIAIRKNHPIYITDSEFEKIMSLDWLDDFYKRVFLFYRETGLRLREPMITSLEGSWLDVSNESKGGVSRNIELSRPLCFVFMEYKKWLQFGHGSKIKDSGEHISKVFKKALKDISVPSSKHFHSLRHTFAVRQLISGTSIYDLKILMGHSSVVTTEQYSNMNLKRVSQDFPSLVLKAKKNTKIGIMDTQLMDTSLLDNKYIA